MRSASTAALALSLLALPALAAVTGTVMTGDGAAIAGARVSLYALESPDARYARLLSDAPEALPLATTQTDSKGNFTLDSPKDATVSLRVFARGYEPREQMIERDETVGAIALSKGETRTGSVTAAGKPVANALVSIQYGNFEYVTRTNAEGRYDAPDPKRARSIAVVHPGYAVDEEIFLTNTGQRLDRSLSAGVTLTGRTTTSDGSSGISKATVMVDGWPLATSADDGAFAIAHAPAKWTQLVARKDALLGQRAFSSDKTQTIRMAKAGTIAGRVTDAKTKLPVAGAVIRLGQRRTFLVDTPTIAISDAKGAYTLIVPPGTYMSWPAHPAYDGAPLDISVTAGQTVTRDLTLDPLARVTGVVVDEGKKLVAAANVMQEESRDLMMRGPFRMMRDSAVISAPDGRFAIRIHGEEEFRLRVSKKGVPEAKSDPLKVAPGDRRSGVVIVVPNGVAVTGRVTDRENNPLSGVSVTPSETQNGGRGGMQRMIFMGLPQQDDDAVRTAPDGTFTLRVMEGTYDFAFAHEGYAPKSVRAQTVSASGQNVVETSLDPAVSITGRVTRGGTGVEGVRIFGLMGGGDSVLTGPDGSFTIGGLAPGSIRVMLRKEGDFIDESRTLEAPAQDVVIDLPGGSRVSGHVYEKGSRKPITSFQAGISTSRTGGGMIMMSPPQLRSFTSDDGSFVLEHVPPGAKTVLASAPGFATARTSVNVEEGKPIENVDLELDTGVKLLGKVTGANGAPLPDVTVRLVPSSTGSFASSGDRRAMTDENGEYSLDALEPGDEAVEFSHPKHLSARKEVTLKGRETRLDVQLSSGQRVTGVVVTDAGAAVGDADVMAMAAGGSLRSTRTDAGGTFTFDSLSPARYRFTASKSGYADGTLEDFDLAGGAQPRIVMHTGGVIYGHVSGLTEQELASANVVARSGGSESEAPVDASGNYRVEGAPTGTVAVSASVMSRDFARRKSSSVHTVELSAGGSAQVDLEFRSDNVIRGRVTRNGRPLSGGSVAFNSRTGGSQSSASVPTDEQGNYTVSGLEEGEYNVSVVDMQRLSSYSTTYRVSGSGTFDIDYSAGSVRGRVIDATSNEAIANANVQLRASTLSDSFRGARVTTTDASGAFAFDTVSSGSYVVNASKEGFGNQATDLAVSDSGVDGLELRLARNDGVSMRVIDGRDGRALRAMVWVFDASGRMVYEAPMMFGGADDATDVKLPLAAGPHTATVTSIGYATRTVSFTSPSTQTVALTPGGTIAIHSKHPERVRVRLLDAGGNLYPRMGMRMPVTSLNPSPGMTTIENVAPGTYTLQLVGDNEATIDQQQVTVTEGAVTETEI